MEDTIQNEERGFEGGEFPAELRALGEAVGRLPRPGPPADLASRTLEHVSAELPAGVGAETGIERFRRRTWWLRPITHPYARVAAAFVLFSTLGVFANLDIAERLGLFSERVIGERATDRVEAIVDRVLLTYGPVRLSDEDIDALVGGHGFAPRAIKEARPGKQNSTAAPGKEFTV